MPKKGVRRHDNLVTFEQSPPEPANNEPAREIIKQARNGQGRTDSLITSYKFIEL